MLHLYYGNDTITVRQKAHDFASSQGPEGATIERIDGDTYAQGVLADVAGSSSLFGGAQVYLVDTPSLKTEIYDDVMEHLEMLAASAHTFVVIEEAMLAPEKKKWQKHVASLEEFKKAADQRYNVFAMADSLSSKNKRQLWLQLQDAKAAGLSAEEIIGTLWWQLKTLRLAQVAPSAEAAGLKEFPYSKAKRALGVFNSGELERMSRDLLGLYHDGHGGIRDIDNALEHFVLTL